MGRRGPAATPTAILDARNSWRAKANKKTEPQPATGEPTPPAGLSKSAKVVWRNVVGLVGVGVLTRDNGQSLARYCVDLVLYWKLARWLEKDKHCGTYTLSKPVFDKAGGIVGVEERVIRHPNLMTMEKLKVSLLRLEQEFGLTPGSRTRIHAVTADAKKKPAAASGGDVPVMRMAQ
jgi:P27 family predicted phage terminase small subunit